jgi:hypothetical protein
MYRGSARKSGAWAGYLSERASDASEAADLTHKPGGAGRLQHAAQQLQRYL